MPAWAMLVLKAIISTLGSVLMSVWTDAMREWLFWFIAEKLVKSTKNVEWDDLLLKRMKAERDKARLRADSKS